MNQKSFRKYINIDLLRSILKNTKNKFIMVREYLYDLRQYSQYSATYKKPSFDKNILEGRIMAHSHVIEKGLSFGKIKPKFGQATIKNMIKLINDYEMKYDTDNSVPYLSALNVLETYIKYHEENKIDLGEFKDVINKIVRDNKNSGDSLISLSKNEMIAVKHKEFKAFSASRHSVRNYSEEEVAIDLILEAVKIAQTAPSACNRQCTRVHIVVEKDMIQRILQLQQGNRGFGHLINKLIIVSASQAVFIGVEERNQAYIDSGIFTMELLHGLHYCGLGSCTLCWSMNPKKEKKLRKLVDIPRDERVVLMIGVGHLLEKYKVAKSARLPLESICHIS